MNKYNIRKAKAGELDKIIDVANSAFIPVRTPDYDFIRTIPKIYNTSHDYSDIYHVAEVDGKLVAICGNLIRTIDVDGEYELHFKVYRMDKFVEMLLKINSHITKFSDCVEIYEIDGGLI